MNDNGLRERVRAAIVRTFRLPADTPAAGLQMGSVPQWDSMGHMTLVMELEREFRVSFPTHQLVQIVNIDAIVRSLEHSGVGNQ